MMKSIYEIENGRVQKLRDALAKEERKLEELAKTYMYPLKSTIHLYGSQDTMYDKGKELGLNDAQMEVFMYTAYEVEIDIDILLDGSVLATSLNGVILPNPVAL